MLPVLCDIKSLQTTRFQMVYKCRLLYARVLSTLEINGVVDPLAQNLLGFLAGCEGKMQAKIREHVLQYYNPMIALSAEAKNQKQDVEKLPVANGSTKVSASTAQKHSTSPENVPSDSDYECQLAMLRAQITGIRHQVPFIGQQLQTFGRKLAFAESALRSKQRHLELRKVSSTHTQIQHTSQSLRLMFSQRTSSTRMQIDHASQLPHIARSHICTRQCGNLKFLNIF